MSNRYERYPQSWNVTQLFDGVLHQGSLECYWIIALTRQQTAIYRIKGILPNNVSFSIVNALESIRLSRHRIWIDSNGGLKGGEQGLFGIQPFFLTQGLSAEYLTMQHGLGGCVLTRFDVYVPSHFETRVEFRMFLSDCLRKGPVSISVRVVEKARELYNYGTTVVYNPPADAKVRNGHVTLGIASDWDAELGTYYIKAQDTYGLQFGVAGIVKIGVDAIDSYVVMEYAPAPEE